MTAPRGGHTTIYRSLLHLYPADFRCEYSDLMLQLFSDQIRTQGPVRSWFKALGDIPGSAMSEHLRRNRTVAHSVSVAPSPFTRMLGLLGVIGGGFLMLGFFQIITSPDLFNLRLVLFNLGAIAVAIAVHQRQATAHRMLSLTAAIAVIASNALYMVLIIRGVALEGEISGGDYQPVWLWFVASAAMWLSDAWFGAVAFRLNKVNRISALALVVGSILAFVGMGNFRLVRSGTLLETAVLGGVFIHGLAWLLLGLEVAFRRRPAPTASA